MLLLSNVLQMLHVLLPRLQCAARGPDHHIDEIELYLQCIFTQLDLLQRWVQEQQALCERQAADAAAQATAAGAGGVCTLAGWHVWSAVVGAFNTVDSR
jgi:hypothetical protein